MADTQNVGSFANNVATCVIANTNTRSKNNSRGVTRCSWSTAATGMPATLPSTCLFQRRLPEYGNLRSRNDVR